MKNGSKHALLIDGNALIHRGWHALPPMTDSEGHLVQAVYGFASVLLKLLPQVHPEYLVVCWDTPEPTYRHTAAPEYKAQREEQPQDFYDQLPWTKEVVAAMGGTNVELPGYEADDLLGTLATHFAQEGAEVTVLTSDRDAWQLISPKIKVLAFKKGVSETITYDEAMLKEATGLTPAQIVDFKAMRGDSSDNLKGVPGIGEKTATELLLKFHDLQGIYKAAKDEKSDLSDSVRRKLLDGEKAAFDTLPLVKLVLNAPISLDSADYHYRSADAEEVKRVFLRFGFKSLLARLETKPMPAVEGEISQTEPVDRKGKKKGAKKQAADAAPASVPFKTSLKLVKVTSAKEALEILSDVSRDDGVVIRPMAAQQGSLFAENVGVALAFGDLAVLIPQSIYREEKVRREMTVLFETASIAKIGHNLKLVCHWAKKEGFEVEGLSFDTEIAAYLLAAGEGGYELDVLAAAKLNVFLPEGEDRVLAEAATIRMLTSVLKKELEQEKLLSVFERFELPLIPALAKMEETGILVDRPYFKKLAVEFVAEKARLEKELVKLAGVEFNPASPSQLADVLFVTLGLPTKGIKRGKSAYSTAASELEKLEGQHPIIDKIGEYREVSKLLSTYIETIPEKADANGRVHTTYNQTLASSGRLSSEDPNLQNIPIRSELGRKIRRGFIAEKGYVLLSCDYSQIQLRIIAALADDKKMLEAFHKSQDVHSATAAAIWKVPIEEVTPDQRRAAKTINFGILYGQGANALAKGAGITFAEAKQFIKEYFTVYSGIREYLDLVKALAHSQGYVETLFGRRRPMPDINSPIPMIRASAERMAINMPVQGTEADIMKLGLVAVAQHLPKIHPEARLLLQVHDELVLEVPEEDIETLAPKITDLMANVTSIGCPIVVEAKYGKNWEDMKKM